jgi:uncharacterized protein (TIGR00290 family)
MAEMKNEPVMMSWSGGKDCCLACHMAMKQGRQIKYLVNFISREYKRCCFHGTEAGLLRLQAELLGIPLVQHEVTADMKEYEKEFKEAVGTLAKKEKISAMVFGDIYLDEHRDWVDRVCADLAIEAIEPLWGRKPEDLVREFVELGFEAIVVSCQADKFGSDFVGRRVDLKMLAELQAMGLCPCGENGEFHTLVVNGPVFRRKIEILEAEPVLKEGFWKYWFLDIKRFR